MLKQQLLDEAAKLSEVSVPLDSIFEAVELSDEVKTQFSTVFETTVKKYAANLAESHINSIANLAEEKCELFKEEAEQKAETSLTEAMGKFIDHLSKEWLEENKLAVDKGIKAELFESLFTGIKDLVIDHNVILPEESVDVVAELEDELTETKDELRKIFDEKVSLAEQVESLQKATVMEKQTKDLTESQKERVVSLVEGLSWGDNYEDKLTSIVDMVVKSTKTTDPITESTINNTDDGLNYAPEQLKEQADEDHQKNSLMGQYIRSAERIK